MAETKQLLVLRLDGPLQSWGENAKWDFRDSSTMPTKSGIVGLLGCAMGEERGSAVLVELAQAITVAVRADRPGRKSEDFHSVTGFPLRNAEGKQRTDSKGKPSDTFTTRREYLEDACFTVFIDTTLEWRKRITAALENPKWCMYLGRKNCVPGRPIQAQIVEYAGLLVAISKHTAAERAEEVMTYECEIPDSAKASLLRPDDLAGANRQFVLRRVWRGTVQPKEVQDVSD